MKKYLIYLDGEQVTRKRIAYDEKPKEKEIEVSKQEYDALVIPSSCEFNDNGEVINIIPATEPELPEPELPEPTIEEILLTALLEIQELKQRITELEDGQ